METHIKPIRILATDTTVEEIVYGEQVSELEYKLLESAVFASSLTYGTTVLIKTSQDDKLVFDGIKEPSSFQTSKFLLSDYLTQDDVNRLGKDIIENGGYWEVLMKGIFIIHVPRDLNYDFNALFEKQGYKATLVVDEADNSVQHGL